MELPTQSRVHMAHVPKRAANHALHVISSEVRPVDLKPGQHGLYTTGLYTTEAKARGESYLTDEQFRRGSTDEASRRLLPEDYATPRKPCVPAALRSPRVDEGANHWRSEYSVVFSPRDAPSKPLRRAPFEAVCGQEVVRHPGGTSSYQIEFGMLGGRGGEDRRDSLDRLRDDLTRGTTKGTGHIAGYQGFLPQCTVDPKVVEHEQGTNTRSIDKSSLMDNFQSRMPGYSGHLPISPQNKVREVPHTAR